LDIISSTYVYADTNPCTLGTHSCTSSEICISTDNGFECQPLLQPSMPSLVPESLTMYKRKQMCEPGYAYNAYEKKCEGNEFFLIKIYINIYKNVLGIVEPQLFEPLLYELSIIRTAISVSELSVIWTLQVVKALVHSLFHHYFNLWCICCL